jgi:chemotaxis signal transduction protein
MEARAAIIVRAGASTIAVPLVDVVEILPVGRVTPLPGTTAPVVGVVAWRGRVLAAHSLGSPASSGATAAQPVIVVGDARTPIALVVDAIDDIRQIAAAAVPDGTEQPATDLPTLGITSDAIAVLDVPALRRRVTDAAANES